MLSSSTISTESDTVDLARNDVILSSSHFQVPIGSVTFSHSEGCHIGPKIVAQSVTWVNEVDEENKKAKSILNNNIMIIVVATLLAAILILIVIRNKSEINNSVTKPEPGPYTTANIPNETTITPWEPTSETTPTPLPKDWMVSYNNWSINKDIPCIKSTPGYTISLETIESSNCRSSKDYLISYENKYTLKHNFYISGDGYVFEGYGWNCSTEYKYRYSRSVIKVAFFCSDDFSHIKLLKNLIMYGLDIKKLHKEYNILPECCRNSNSSSIDKETMKYLSNEKSKSFKNPTCIGYNSQCNIL